MVNDGNPNDYEDGRDLYADPVSYLSKINSKDGVERLRADEKF